MQRSLAIITSDTSVYMVPSDDPNGGVILSSTNPNKVAEFIRGFQTADLRVGLYFPTENDNSATHRAYGLVAGILTTLGMTYSIIDDNSAMNLCGVCFGDTLAVIHEQASAIAPEVELDLLDPVYSMAVLISHSLTK